MLTSAIAGTLGGNKAALRWYHVDVRRLRLRHPVRLAGAIATGFASSIAIAWAAHRWCDRSADLHWRAFSFDDKTCIVIGTRRGLATHTKVQHDRHVDSMTADEITVMPEGLGFPWPVPRIQQLPNDRETFAPGANGIVIDKAGFPFACVYMREDSEAAGCFHSTIAEHGAFRFSKPTGLSYPALPLWSGLAANSALYAGGWYGVLAIPGWFVRRRRSRAARCVHCGYDTRGLQARTCPECGKEIGP